MLICLHCLKPKKGIKSKQM